MREYGHLKEYDITIKTIGPVFIGSGKSLSKKDYIFDKNQQIFKLVDMAKLGEICSKKGLNKKFVDFFLDPRQAELYRFLVDNRFSPKEYEQTVQYCLKSQDSHLETHAIKEIYLFTQNGQGEFYVPGSSVKGALRTAILTNMLLDEKGKNKQEYINDVNNNLTKIRKYRDKTEPRLLNTLNINETKSEDAVNSIMRGIIVSDSEPISKDDMTIVQKIDYTLGGKEKRMPLFRLCIKPQTEIKLKITFDQRILADSGIDAEYLCKSLWRQYNWNYKNFDSVFQALGKGKDANNDSEPLFYLGGGSGFASKTFVTAHTGSKTGLELTGKILNAQFKNHHHETDKENGASPHVRKIAVYQNKKLPMGLCCFIME